jgi:hypothetical protein
MIGRKNVVAAKLKNKMKEFEGMTFFPSVHCVLY